jgi:hypothetical protein
MRTVSIVALFLLFAGTALAQMPRFEEYPAKNIFRGPNAPVILSRVDRAIRNRIRVTAKQKPNFAGHYILLTWSCGEECLTGAAIDAITGKVYTFPITLCCWKPEGVQTEKPIEFHLTSTLMVLKGGRNGKACDLAMHYYKLENDRFELVMTTSLQQCP